MRRDGFSIDALLTEMDRKGAKAKIVIIDAARQNPFERRFRTSSAGLAPMAAPAGTLAMYSAGPGKLIPDRSGTNSVFMSELIKELRVPSSTFEEAFNHTRLGVSRASSNEQVPWVVSSLVDELYLGGSRPVATVPSSAPALVEPAPTPAPVPVPASPVKSIKPPARSAATAPGEPLHSDAKPGTPSMIVRGAEKW